MKILKVLLLMKLKRLIDIMNIIIYTPPYQILFGRIVIGKPNQKQKLYPNIKNINELFYEGLGLPEFTYKK